MTSMKSLKGIVSNMLTPGEDLLRLALEPAEPYVEERLLPKYEVEAGKSIGIAASSAHSRHSGSSAWKFSEMVLGSDITQGYLFLVIPTSVLRSAYDVRLDLDGHLVTNKTIPFSMFEPAWYGMYNERTRSRNGGS